MRRYSISLILLPSNRSNQNSPLSILIHPGTSRGFLPRGLFQRLPSGFWRILVALCLRAGIRQPLTRADFRKKTFLGPFAPLTALIGDCYSARTMPTIRTSTFQALSPPSIQRANHSVKSRVSPGLQRRRSMASWLPHTTPAQAPPLTRDSISLQ